MPGMKMAISLEQGLFDRATELALAMQISRSKLFALAMRDYLKKQETAKFLTQLNAAYDDHPTEQETTVSKSLQAKHRRNTKQVGLLIQTRVNFERKL